MVQLWQSRPLQRGTAGSLSPAQQAAAEMIYNANRVYTDTKNNIQRVVNIVLNGSVSNAYKITSLMAMIGQGKKYTANNNPRTTLSTLFVQYDKATQSKKQDNERNWSTLWQTSLPIEDKFYHKETYLLESRKVDIQRADLCLQLTLYDGLCHPAFS